VILPAELIQQNNDSRYKPEMDGVDHINVHTWSKTPLGKLLAAEADCRFQHPEFGPFRSINAFYFWVTHVNVPDEIRDAYGTKMQQRFGRFKVRQIGNLNELVIGAHIAKISQNVALIKMLRDCILPFTCYYTNKAGLIIEVPARQPLLQFLEEYRAYIQRGCKPSEFSYKTQDTDQY